MCLTTSLLPRVASRTIYAVKAFGKKSGNRLISPFLEYEWEIGVEETANFEASINRYSGLSVQFFEGLHAYTGLKSFKDNSDKFYRHVALVKIPKGTRFTVNDEEDTLVAERMEIVRYLGPTKRSNSPYSISRTFNYSGPNLPINVLAVLRDSPVDEGFKRFIKGRREKISSYWHFKHFSTFD